MKINKKDYEIMNLKGEIYSPIDNDILELIKELNKLKFLKTIHSCSVHDNRDAYISFYILDVKKTFDFIYDLIDCLDKFYNKKYCHKECKCKIAMFESGYTKNTVSLHLDLKPYKEILLLWREALRFTKKYKK